MPAADGDSHGASLATLELGVTGAPAAPRGTYPSTTAPRHSGACRDRNDLHEAPHGDENAAGEGI